jgi:hypothetical protein
MTSELRDLYRRAATWTIEKIDGAQTELDVATPCDKWDLRALLNHMLETQRYFVASAQDHDASPPSPEPPALISAAPSKDFIAARDELLAAYADDETLEKRAQGLGVAFSDILIHGWDVARARVLEPLLHVLQRVPAVDRQGEVIDGASHALAAPLADQLVGGHFENVQRRTTAEFDAFHVRVVVGLLHREAHRAPERLLVEADGEIHVRR